jgi:hypothetical protein
MGFLKDRLTVGLQNAAKDLRAIASLNVPQEVTPVQRDAEEVVKTVESYDAPASVVDLALKLKWEPERLARALTFASEHGRLTLGKFKDQTFVGLPVESL